MEENNNNLNQQGYHNPNQDYNNNSMNINQDNGYGNTPNNMPNYNSNNISGNMLNNNSSNSSKNNSGFFTGMTIGIVASVVIFAIAIIVKAIVGDIGSGGNSSTASDVETEDMEAVLSKAESILEYLDAYYYNADDDYKKKIADGIYQGIIDVLDDDYADYYDAEEWKEILESDKGVYCGIGVVVQSDTETGEVIVVNPYDYAPGYKAGIRVDDRIIAIDDIDITGMSLDEAVSLIRGEEGTDVKVTVRRNGEILDFVVTREEIETQTIYTEVMEGNIGYMQISSFDGVTGDQFTKGLEELLDQDIEGIIFDVRSNGGGYYYTVVEMLDRILPEGKIVYMEDRDGAQDIEYSDAECLDLPMCVLVNQYTASASEIFAGAIQDYELGAIIGNKTFGKGIVQNTYTFTDGTAIKFTIAGYFTPNGRNIHGEGIVPDIEVSLPDSEDAYENGVIKDGMDSQLNKAIEYIQNEIK